MVHLFGLKKCLKKLKKLNKQRINKMEKMTRQGVRDLDARLGKVKLKKIELPIFSCRHRNMIRHGENYYCPECNLDWDAKS